jgi:hypothetical protein
LKCNDRIVVSSQVAFSNSALVSLVNADRQSLLAELGALRAQVATMNGQGDDASDQMTSHTQQLGELLESCVEVEISI